MCENTIYTYNTTLVSHASEVGEIVARTYPSEILSLGKILILGEIQKACDCVVLGKIQDYLHEIRMHQLTA